MLLEMPLSFWEQHPLTERFPDSDLRERVFLETLCLMEPFVPTVKAVILKAASQSVSEHDLSKLVLFDFPLPKAVETFIEDMSEQSNLPSGIAATGLVGVSCVVCSSYRQQLKVLFKFHDAKIESVSNTPRLH
jgi:hypothetical protein